LARGLRFLDLTANAIATATIAESNATADASSTISSREKAQVVFMVSSAQRAAA
jgi:hypothetical protein